MYIIGICIIPYNFSCIPENSLVKKLPFANYCMSHSGVDWERKPWVHLMVSFSGFDRV